MPIALLWGLTTARAAPCAAPTTELALDAALAASERGYRELDPAAFEAGRAEAEEDLRCLGGPVRPSIAARYHRLRGLAAFAEGREASAAEAFASARAADPEITLGRLVPAGHALELLFVRDDPSGATAAAPRPADGRILLDGVPGAERPLTRPVIVQWLDDADAARFTEWVPPGAALPDYPRAAVPRDPVAGRGGRRKVGGVLLGVGGGAAVGAGVLLGSAAVLDATFEADHPEWDVQDLEVARDRANRARDAALVTSAAAATLLSAGLVLRW